MMFQCILGLDRVFVFFLRLTKHVKSDDPFFWRGCQKHEDLSYGRHDVKACQLIRQGV